GDMFARQGRGHAAVLGLNERQEDFPAEFLGELWHGVLLPPGEWAQKNPAYNSFGVVQSPSSVRRDISQSRKKAPAAPEQPRQGKGGRDPNFHPGGRAGLIAPLYANAPALAQPRAGKGAGRAGACPNSPRTR